MYKILIRDVSQAFLCRNILCVRHFLFEFWMVSVYSNELGTSSIPTAWDKASTWPHWRSWILMATIGKWDTDDLGMKPSALNTFCFLKAHLVHRIHPWNTQRLWFVAGQSMITRFFQSVFSAWWRYSPLGCLSISSSNTAALPLLRFFREPSQDAVHASQGPLH